MIKYNKTPILVTIKLMLYTCIYKLVVFNVRPSTRQNRLFMLKNKPVTKTFGGNSRPCNSKEIDKFG